MSSQPRQTANVYMESLPQGSSQIHPDPNSHNVPTAPVTHPNITAFSMAYHWEHLLSRERNRSRNLEYWVDALQSQVRKAEANFDNLKQEHERLFILVQRHSCRPANSPTSPNDCEAKALSPTLFMPPPFRPPPPTVSQLNEAAQGVKRKLDVPTVPNKRHRLALNVEQPISPRTIFSPSTPLAMNANKD